MLLRPAKNRKHLDCNNQERLHKVKHLWNYLIKKYADKGERLLGIAVRLGAFKQKFNEEKFDACLTWESLDAK